MTSVKADAAVGGCLYFFRSKKALSAKHKVLFFAAGNHEPINKLAPKTRLMELNFTKGATVLVFIGFNSSLGK